MKGARTVLPVASSNIPISNRKIINGISHHFFLSRKNMNKSFINSILSFVLCFIENRITYH